MKLLSTFVITLTLVVSSGCSSLGLSLWPTSFPLLNQTKDLAAASPRPTGLNHELAKATLPEYYIEAGDRILIESTELDSEFRAIGDQKVQVDGSVDIGHYGRLRVAGMTVEAIEYMIEERIREVDGEPEAINVQLIETNAATVYVLGEVGSPGSYPIDGNETVLDAILMAGGLTSSASPCDIVLVRPTNPAECRVVLPVCYRQLTQIGDATTNYQVQPGDRIVVGARTLCEELAFWKQRKQCEGCACSHCVECAPASVNYTNRIMQFASHFPLPRKFKKSAQSSEVVPSNAVDRTSDSQSEATLNAIPRQSTQEDASSSDRSSAPAAKAPAVKAPAPPVEEAEIFLPAIEPNKAPANSNPQK